MKTNEPRRRRIQNQNKENKICLTIGGFYRQSHVVSDMNMDKFTTKESTKNEENEWLNEWIEREK